MAQQNSFSSLRSLFCNVLLPTWFCKAKASAPSFLVITVKYNAAYTNLPKHADIKIWPDLLEMSRTLRINQLEVGSQKSEVESRKSEVGSRKSEVGSRNSEVGNRKSLLGFRITCKKFLTSKHKNNVRRKHLLNFSPCLSFHDFSFPHSPLPLRKTMVPPSPCPSLMCFRQKVTL